MTSLPGTGHWRVEVEWDDSTVTGGGRWQDVSEALSDEARTATRILSVGFVLADDDAGVVLAASVHGSEAAGVTHIPRGVVRSMVRLVPSDG